MCVLYLNFNTDNEKERKKHFHKKDNTKHLFINILLIKKYKILKKI